MRRIAATAVAMLALLPATAQAGPCQPGPQHPTLQATFEDISLNQVLAGPPTVYAGHRIGIDGRFPDAGVGGRDGVIPGSLKISAPGAPTTEHDAGHQLAVIPQAAGTIPVTFTWTESRNPTDPNPVATCDGSAVVDMTVRESRRPSISLRTSRSATRPRLTLRLALGFTEKADASPITLRARAVNGATPPKSRLRRIAALPIDRVSRGLHRRIGAGAFGVAELFYSATAEGGVANLRWTGRRNARGALSVDLVQRGKVRARIRGSIRCGRTTCRTTGLRFTKP
ncbi:MAG TPA: hypothetical protein VFZ89_07245 [Solirubrobacteraceae bacterium]